MIRKILSIVFVMALIVLADTTRVIIMPDYYVLLQQEAIKNTKQTILAKIEIIEKMFTMECGSEMFSTTIILGERYKAFNRRSVGVLQSIVNLDRYMGDKVTAGYIKNSHRLAVIERLLSQFKKLS